jgi:hypothetical protein
MPGDMKKLHACAFWGDYRRHVPALIHIPLSGSDQKAHAKGIRYRSDVHAIAFVFRKARSRACRSEFAQSCRPALKVFL